MELAHDEPRVLAPRAGLLDLLSELRALAPEDLRAEVRAWLRDPAPGSRIGRIAERLLVDPDDAREFLENTDAVLALVHGRVADLHGLRCSIPVAEPVERSGEARIEAWAGATIEGDGDGRLFGRLLRFDRKRYAAIRIGVGATASGRLSERDAFGEATAAAAFSGGAEFVLDNVFLHERDEPALDVVRADLHAFLPPWRLDGHRLDFRDGKPRQFVHLGGAGSIEIGGRARWRDARFTRVALGDEGILDAALAFAGGVSATANFTATLHGDFHVLIEPAAGERLRVHVARGSSSRQSARVAAGADLTITGIAPLARGVVRELVGELPDFVATLAERADRWTDLHALFAGEVDRHVEDILGDERFTRRLEEWLEEIRIRVEVRRRLRALVARAAGAAAAEAIDRIEEEIGPAVEAVRRAVARLYAVFRRIEEAIDAAARVRIGVALSRATKRTEESDAAFVFDIDPAAEPATFRDMLRGRFAGAFEHAASGSPAVRLEQGPLGRSGSFEIRTALDVTLIGRTIGTGTILEQEWEYEVSATGEIEIAAEASLEKWRRAWRSVRAVALRVESEADGATASDRLVVEASIEFEPNEPELRDHENAMIELGVLDGPTTMMQELPIEAKRFSLRPFGRIESAAALRLSWEDVRAIVEGQLPLARGTIARHLARWASPPASFLRRRGTDRLPLFAWPSTLAWADEPIVETHRTIRFADVAGRVHVDVPAGAPLRAVALYARTVLLFERLLRRLGEWERTAAGAGEDALEIIRRDQRELLRAAAPLLQFPSSAVGFALIGTLIDLLPDSSTAQTSLVIRREDRKRFVY